MSVVVITPEEARREPYSSFETLSNLSTKEDIATLVDTLEEVQKSYGYKGYNIVNILHTNDDKYILVCDKNSKFYDFFTEVNGIIKDNNLLISPTNAKLKFPKNLSKGYYGGSSRSFNDVSTSIQGDTSTGFISADEMMHMRRETSIRQLLYVAKDDRISINDERGVVFGRNSDVSNYVIRDKSVSRSHAMVYLRNGRVFVHDNNSCNGTYVDGVRVNPSYDVEVPRGGRILMGTVEFILI